MPDKHKNIMLGTAGHVDHGKTSLVKLLTGCDTDRLAEEKRRGLTIELGFAPCKMTDDRIVGIVDVPGHVSFIRHMVAGAHGVDVIILVVAADDGVMPQTREHLDVMTLMGARRGLVALTKIDLVDEEMRELAIEDVRGALAETFLADAPICPVSNVTGEGFEGFFKALDEQVAACEPRVSFGPYRQWVERSFIAHGFGVVASGIPTTGELKVGAYVRVLPGDLKLRVRGLQVYGDDAQVARLGECAAVNLADVDLERLPRGVVLTTSTTLIAVSQCAARLRMLGRSKRALRDGTEVHLHVGTEYVQAKVIALEGGPIEPSDEALVQLRFERELPVSPGDRFVVRTHVEEAGGLMTIGGGVVLDTTDKRMRRKRAEVLEPLKKREAALGDPAAWCLALLEEVEEPTTVEALVERAVLLDREVEPALDTLKQNRDVVSLDDRRVLAKRVIERAGEKIVERLREEHAANPDQFGLTTAILVNELGMDGDVAANAVAGLCDNGIMTRQGELLALAEYRPAVSAADQKLLDAIVDLYKRDHFAAKRPTEAAEALGEPMKRVEPMVKMLFERGDLIKLTDQIVMHRDAVAAAVGVVRNLFEKSERFSTAEFRDALGASRKYVIPLLDYFDHERLTIRHGSQRKPGAKLREEVG